MRVSFLFSITLLYSSALFAQENKSFSFTVEGKINVDSGEVILSLAADASYYPQGDEMNMTTRVNKGKFSFSGHTPYLIGVKIIYERQYRSGLFIIEPGVQYITCNIDSSKVAPKVSNHVMKEYKEYADAFAEIKLKRESHRVRKDSLRALYQNKISDSINLVLEQEINKIYVESDSILLKYVAAHPDSYVSLWKLIELFSFVGYENIYDSISTQLSDSLRDTYTGQVLNQKLKVSSVTADGKKFPSVIALDRQNNQLNSNSFLKNKYTFIDFWYSNCRPCIAQFPHLRKIYEQYKDQGFEIIAISTDKVKYKKMWQKAIDKYELTWPQYWDKDGVAASKLSINKFPTNYLLNSQGKIIGKDLRPVVLDQFLEENMR